MYRDGNRIPITLQVQKVLQKNCEINKKQKPDQTESQACCGFDILVFLHLFSISFPELMWNACACCEHCLLSCQDINAIKLNGPSLREVEVQLKTNESVWIVRLVTSNRG